MDDGATRILSWIIGLCFVMSLLPAISRGAEQTTIWDREILSQPFEKQPFRQVAIPDWLQDTLGCGYTLSVMKAQQRDGRSKHGVTISEMGFVDPFYAYYDSKLLEAPQSARAAGSTGEGHRRVQTAGRAHPRRLSALPAGRSLRKASRLAADRDEHHRNSADRHGQVIRTAACSACSGRTAISSSTCWRRS